MRRTAERQVGKGEEERRESGRQTKMEAQQKGVGDGQPGELRCGGKREQNRRQCNKHHVDNHDDLLCGSWILCSAPCNV